MPKLPTRRQTTTAEQTPAPTPAPAPQPEASQTSAVATRTFASAVAPLAPISAPGSGDTVPWLRFHHSNAKNFGEVARALPSLPQGHAYVAEPTATGTTYHNVKAFWLFAAQEFYVTKTYDGREYTIVNVSRKQNRADAKQGREIVALVLAVTDVGIIPCVAVFDKARCVVVQGLAQAVLERGGNWREVLVTPQYQPRTGKSGYTYVEVNGAPRAVNADEARALHAWLGDADEQEVAEATHVAWRAKVNELASLVTD